MFEGDEFDTLGFAASPDGDAVADSAKSYAEWFPGSLLVLQERTTRALAGLCACHNIFALRWTRG